MNSVIYPRYVKLIETCLNVPEIGTMGNSWNVQKRLLAPSVVTGNKGKDWV